MRATRSVRGIALAACVAAQIALAATAGAQEVDPRARAAARELGYEGVAAYQAGRYTVALDKLERAFRVVRVPTLGLWSARALVKTGRLVEGAERYLEVVRMQDYEGERDVQAGAKIAARAEHSALRARIPSVVVALEGGDASGVTVTLDGAPVAPPLVGVKMRVNPGEHRVEARRGDRVASRRFSIAEGEAQRVVLDVQGLPAGPRRAAADPGSAQRRGAIVAGSLGLTGLAVGAVLGLVARSRWQDAKAACPAMTACPDAKGQELSAEAKQLAGLATSGFVAGALGAATGVTLWFTAPGRAAPRGAGAGVAWMF
jgi:hypothetical protein